MYNAFMKFAEKLKLLRKEFGFTQNELAKKIGISGNRHISLLEKGAHQPSLESIQKLASLFNVSTDYLIFEDVPRGNSVHVKNPELFDLIDQLVNTDNQQAIDAVKYLIKSSVLRNKIEDVTR
ncbi:MAG: helix-turn-helix transcriptional regulator, partial [Desulfobacteraceae bacterium]|nr:helix-turn-helix transcriptional regulator [Desulfobacteraceae bacterium]